MSLRQQAKILRVQHSTLSKCINGQIAWNPELKARYEELTATTFATTRQSGDSLAQENQSANQAQYRNSGGAGETRTPYLFNAIEALSQMSYSPT
tara:strand:- start:752 stop:1036 length:285 start_codon:yes stop_codon:yes gene_type:complete